MSWTKTHAAALRAAFAALDGARIDWLVLRNHQGLPEFNRSKDVDLCLGKTDFPKAEVMISGAMRKAGFDRWLVEDFQYVRCMTFFSTHEAVPLSIKIDLLDGFVFRGAQLFAFPDLYRNSREDNGFKIPGKADDAVMLWAKPLLTGGIVKPKYVSDIQRVARDDPQAFRAILERILSAAWACRVWSKIAAGDIEGTVIMQRSLRQSAWLQALRRNPLETIRDAAHHVISELARRRRRNPATFVSVAGPDGVGKTTFIEHLTADIAELQVKDTDTIIVRHFRPHLLPNINELLTGKPEIIEAIHDPHSSEPASMPSSLIRIIYYWADYVLGYWGILRRLCIRGRIVIFDRYFYDFIVDPRRSRLSLPGWVPRFFLAITPKPDLVFFLDSNAELIYSRKQELEIQEIERQLDAYRSLAKQDPGRFICLDARKTPEAISQDALREMVKRSFAQIDE